MIALCLPSPARGDGIVQTLREYGRFDVFVALIQRAGLEQELDSGGPWTVFAPEQLSEAEQPADPEAATALVRRHLIAGRVSLLALARERPRETPGGHRLHFVDMSGDVLVENRWILQGDIPADNGIIHIVDRALPPPGRQIAVRAGSVRHMHDHAASGELWFGTDTATLGRAVLK